MSEERGPGRPEAIINWDDVGTWISMGANGVECAARLGIHYDTLANRCRSDNNSNFSEFLQQNRSKGDILLKEAQTKKALSGDSTMLIWLGKVRLDQRELKEEQKYTPEQLAMMAQINEFFNWKRQVSDLNNCDNTSINE